MRRDLFNRFVWGAAAVHLLGCSDQLQLNVLIYAPCDQKEALTEANHIQLEVWAPAEGERSEVIWNADAGGGELPQVGLTEAAWVSVVGRESNAAGDPGAAVIAGTVGEIDLSGTDGTNPVDINVVVGRVGQFMDTTDVVEAFTCSGLTGARIDHAAVTLRDGRVLVTGGYRPTSAGPLEWPSFVELYLPAQGLFEPGPSLKGARRGLTATLLESGKVLLAGGEGPIDDVVQSSKSTQLFDPATDTLESPVPLLEDRAYHTATPLGDGRVLIAGGKKGSGAASVPLNTTEVYDPATGTTTQGPQLLQARSHHAAVRVGKSAVAFIGGLGNGGPLDHVEIVDISSGLVVEGDPMRVPRSHLSAALVPGAPGFIAVLGGFSQPVSSAAEGTGLALVELLQIVNTGSSFDAFLSGCTTSLNQPRGAAMLATLASGLLIVGGVSDNQQPLASAEIFTVSDVPACDVAAVNTLGALGTPRAGAAVTSLIGGDLLFTGGLTRQGGNVAAVSRGEIYVQYR